MKNTEGYKVYKAHTTYNFNTVPEREQFLVQVRERTLLGTFFVIQVRHRDLIVAQDKVVRFWKKSGENIPFSNHRADITVSFLGRQEVQYELSLKDFHRSPTVEKGNKVVLISRADGRKTEFVFKPPDKKKEVSRRRSRLMIGLRRQSMSEEEPRDSAQPRQEASDAERFKALFEMNHPLTSPLVPAAAPMIQWQSPFATSTAGSRTSGSGGMSSPMSTSPELQEEPESPRYRAISPAS